MLETLAASPQAVQLGGLALVLGVACVTDLRSGTIPNSLTLGGAIGGLALGMLTGGPAGLLSGAVGWLVTMAVCLAIYATLGMGGGDAKLLAAVGAFRGTEFAMMTLVHTLLLGLLIALPVLLFRRRLKAVLARSYWTAAFLMQGGPAAPGDGAEADSGKLPLALLIAAGAALSWVQPAATRWLVAGGGA